MAGTDKDKDSVERNHEGQDASVDNRDGVEMVRPESITRCAASILNSVATFLRLADMKTSFR
jgi:hypothetical protein